MEDLDFRYPEGELHGQCSTIGLTLRARHQGLHSFGTGSANGFQYDPGTEQTKFNEWIVLKVFFFIFLFRPALNRASLTKAIGWIRPVQPLVQTW